MPMKVTVCFGRVKVLVPCGDGELLVREVIEKAITRYKKAVGKAVDYWVSVHSLQTSSEGSILDPDDTLSDVVDDREQLIADYEEQGGGHSSGNGDGASTCSTGTASPDIFHSEAINSKHLRGYSLDDGRDVDVVVTPRDIATGSGLTVRRGSEPSLTIFDEKKPNSSESPQKKDNFNNEIDDAENNNNIINNNVNNNKATSAISNNNNNNSRGERSYYDAEHTRSLERNPFKRVHQETWRQSLGAQPSMYRWFEAAEKQEEKFKQTELERKEPVGESTETSQSSPMAVKEESTEKPRPARVLPPLPPHARHREPAILICLKNDGSPLGIHVVPDFTEDGRECGLMIQGIEEGGRINKDGRLRVDDRIIEINEHDLHDVTFQKAQEIFRNAMKTDEVRLRVVKHTVSKKGPPAVLPKPKSHTPVKPSPLTLSSLNGQNIDTESPKSSPDETSTPLDKPPESSITYDSVSLPTENAKSPAISPPSPFKKTPPIPPQRHPSTTLSNSTSSSSNKPRKLIIAPTNTKKLGKRIEIQLVKDASGLGFSITTRDNPAAGDSPIYIKNILPEGAAVVDGRLKPGDRLLEVNGVDMEGKSQADAVTVLRNTKLGSIVNIVVSRQEVEDERFKVPRQLNTSDLDTTPPLLQSHEKAGDDGTLAIMRNKELLEFDIPLNDTGSAGLGVSVKGKTLTSEEGTRDLGIFVKAVIHGGAASKDGRLQVNDQLLEVNNNSLVELPNTEAMDILRKAMQDEGPAPGCINIKVARRIGAPSPSPFSQTSPGVFDYTDSTNTSPLDHNISDSLTNSEQNSPEKNHKPLPNVGDLKSPNLFLERVLAGNGLRNESYMRAAHESYVASPGPPGQEGQMSNSSSGIEHHSSFHSNSSSSDDLHQEPAWLQGPDWADRLASVTSEEELSPTGDGFQREGFGRQSMSEKRKGHIDPRTMETYQSLQRIKGAHKDTSKGNDHDGPPASNLKRFSSLENLSSAQYDQENDKSTSFDDEGEGSGQPRMARKRGGNESFRAAVDRSYDPVPANHIEMDPSKPDSRQELPLRRSKSVEEESSEGGSISHEVVNSARSSLSDHHLSEDKKKGGKKNKENRKSTGILKGIFKFGRGRKTPDEHLTKGEGEKHEDRGITDRGGPYQDNQQKQQIWRDAQPQYDRNQDPFVRMQETNVTVPQPQGYYDQNRPPEHDNDFQHQPPGSQPHYPGSQFYPSLQLETTGALSRTEKIQQLRANHQRRHRERQGHYPMEDKEEEYERQIQEEERRVYRYSTDEYVLQKYGHSAIPGQIEYPGQRPRPLSRNQERPTSRVGVSESSLPITNYQDYNEINNYPHGNIHISDPNIQQGFYRPQSRGPVTSSSDFSHLRGQISSTSSDQPRTRGPTPQVDQRFREPTPVQDQRARGATPVNIDQRLRGPTPTNQEQGFRRPAPEQGFRGPTPDQGFRGPTPTQDWYHSDNRDIQRNPAKIMPSTKENISQTQGYGTRNGGFYGSANVAYRDPVFSAMAGKRPVKTLGQPNSAKV